MKVSFLSYLGLLLIIPSLECYSQENSSGAWSDFGHARNWQCNLDLSGDPSLSLKWKKKVGEGYSQIVGNQDRIFVASGGRLPGSDSKIETQLTAYEKDSGKQLWQYVCQSELYGNHQTMGGKQPSPQSTPLLMNDQVVFCTFAGDLICLQQGDGTEIWKISLKDKYDAQAVQFGSASSPIQCKGDNQSFVILAAGRRGGVMKLKLDDGSLVWRCPVRTFGYATPV
ncbi:MAG: PQQ-binding-like beta-propeller repeat protein, partial [Planctomycetota bacterium]